MRIYWSAIALCRWWYAPRGTGGRGRFALVNRAGAPATAHGLLVDHPGPMRPVVAVMANADAFADLES